MEKTNSNRFFQLEDPEFRRLSNYIICQFGIKLPPGKKILLQCRLQKRVKSLRFTSFRDYVDFVLSPQGQHEEVYHMIDAVSTNKTDFFREPVHFDFLLNQGIDEYVKRTGKNKISIWSAGCSSGEEPYTLAMILKEYTLRNDRLDFNILATDIADSVLHNAMNGIYAEEKTMMIPYEYKKKYLLRGKNGFNNKVRVIPELRSKINFRMFNLLNTDYKSQGNFDFIFCRNVMIYFEREVQFRLLKQFCKCLHTGGFLFLGHSESITGYSLPLQHIKPTIFQKI